MRNEIGKAMDPKKKTQLTAHKCSVTCVTCARQIHVYAIVRLATSRNANYITALVRPSYTTFYTLEGGGRLLDSTVVRPWM